MCELLSLLHCNLPHCYSFTMRLFRLLMSLSLVLADDTDYEDCEHDLAEPKFTCENDQKMNSSSNAQESLHRFGWNNISCMIYKSNQLNCSWSTKTLPKNAQYSASYQLSCEGVEHPLHCFPHPAEESIECQGIIISNSSGVNGILLYVVNINIYISGHWCVSKNTYMEQNIEKLDPPKLTTSLIQSEYLEIRWSRPESLATNAERCFQYEIKINDEIVSLENVLTESLVYNATRIDPTKHYRIQIRTKLNKICADAKYWSEWSAGVEVGPSESRYQLNTIVIGSIVFVLPMIVLAILLVCKFQRLSVKLFPSIPSPSGKVKMLLEKDDISHVIPPKHVEWVSESEIFQVIS